MLALSHSLSDFGPGRSRLHGMRQPCEEAHRTRPVNNYTSDLENGPAPVAPSDETAALTDSSTMTP